MSNTLGELAMSFVDDEHRRSAVPQQRHQFIDCEKPVQWYDDESRLGHAIHFDILRSIPRQYPDAISLHDTKCRGSVTKTVYTGIEITKRDLVSVHCFECDLVWTREGVSTQYILQ